MAFRRISKRQRQTPANRIEQSWLALLQDEEPPESANPFASFTFHRKAQELWTAHREAILADWLEEKPNTRPLCWYLFDCPHEPPFPLPRPGTWGRWPDMRPSATAEKKFLRKIGEID